MRLGHIYSQPKIIQKSGRSFYIKEQGGGGILKEQRKPKQQSSAKGRCLQSRIKRKIVRKEKKNIKGSHISIMRVLGRENSEVNL